MSNNVYIYRGRGLEPMTLKMRQAAIPILFSIIVMVCITGCFIKPDTSIFTIDSIKSYRDIPGVTEEEVNAIEALKAERKNFSFGIMSSTEGFILPDGTAAGFSPLFCELLTDLFGIPFETVLYTWDALNNCLDDGTLDFTGELTPTPERRRVFFMTHPIAERSLGVFTYGNAPRINEESELHNCTIGFYKGTITAESIGVFYPTLTFKEVFVNDTPEVAQMLEDGLIDAFVTESVESYTFADNPNIRFREMFPLVYTPVSMATEKAALEPVITVVNKYIQAGGIDKLYELYKKGNGEFEKYAFRNSLTPEEKVYLDNLTAKGASVPIALEADNYPISFYSEEEKAFLGVALDILAEISSLTGISFEVATTRNTPWTTIYEELVSGEISMVSELIRTEERENNFLFSEPYFNSRYALLSKLDFPSLEIYQVIRTTVGIGRQSAYEEMYKLLFPENSNAKYYDSQFYAIRALENGEIDLLMASENMLLTLRNYMEKPNYKANIIFSTPIEESLFGFNKNEVMLHSIVCKAQGYINSEKIGQEWKGRIYDYSRRMTLERFVYLVVFVIFLSLVLMVVFLLFIRISRLKKHFENQAITLSAIYNTIPDLVYCMDTNCRFINCNRSYEKFTGFTEGEIIGKTDLEIYSKIPDQNMSQGYMAINKKVLYDRKTITLEEAAYRYDRNNVILKTTKTPLIQNGKIIGLLGISRDITDHKAAEEAAYAASRAKSNFLAKMSHEIRTPMNAIIGMTELAMRENDIDAVHKHIQTVKQAGAHLLSIINDILDFSKIEVGKLEILEAEYSVSSLVNDIISIIRMRVIDSQVRFAVNINSKIPNALTGDETRIRQVLLNLLSNAVKYTEKGFVSFTMYGEAGDGNYVNLIIEVMDSGKGIKEEDVKNLFSEYSQIDQDKNRGIEGVGLGLAITWNIVKAMGGDIKVYSEYGKGSIFTVTLPQKIAVSQPLAYVKKPEGIKVIVYERREIYANSIVSAICDLGVDCMLVSSNAELQDTLAKEKYNFIFTSFTLYERNRVKISQFAKNVKIVLLAEFGEAVHEKKMSILAMPVYSISLANILNGVAESFTFSEGSEDIVRFIAPDAKVLVVDDIKTNLKVAQGLMLPYKLQVDLCTGGKEAIEAVLFKHYDIIFMDHKMPDMDGVEATLLIRKMGEEDPYYEKVPIIALTANAVSGTREAFLQIGFNDFISKPIDTVRLNSVLEKWIPKGKQKIAPKKDSGIDQKDKNGNEKSFEIAGIDTAKGIFLSGGTQASYLETLEIYYKDGFEKIREIAGCLETGDMNLYTVHVHALKSASANIGALELSEIAATLESAGERKDAGYIELHTPAFLAALKTMLGEIEGLLLKNKEKSGEENDLCSMEILIPELGKLMAALEVLDAGIINKSIDDLQKLTKSDDIGGAIQNISDKILIGEYDGALESVKTLLSEVKNGKN